MVFGIATTAWAQDAAPADAAAAPAAEPAPAAPAAEAAPTAGVAASSAEPGKFFLGLRLGYGLPMGDAVKDGKMSDGVSGQIPIWLDVGYMVTKNIMVGLYGQYGIVSMADNTCVSGADCSASDMRFGVQGQYHIMPTEKINPWVGLGVGYEILSWTVKAGGAEGNVKYKGMEFVNIQGGADFKVTPGIGIGPFLSFSMGQYGSASMKTTGTGADVDTSEDITDKAMHEWLTFGVRGAFNL
jgi:outer membrane protein W